MTFPRPGGDSQGAKGPGLDVVWAQALGQNPGRRALGKGSQEPGQVEPLCALGVGSHWREGGVSSRRTGAPFLGRGLLCLLSDISIPR